jgi:hypothetical protein
MLAYLPLQHRCRLFEARGYYKKIRNPWIISLRITNNLGEAKVFMCCCQNWPGSKFEPGILASNKKGRAVLMRGLFPEPTGLRGRAAQGCYFCPTHFYVDGSPMPLNRGAIGHDGPELAS